MSEEKPKPFKLDIKKHTAVKAFPAFGIFMGCPKVGKSTFMASIPNCLILDLEHHGYDHIDVEAVAPIKNKDELIDGIDEYMKSLDYEVLIIDHMRAVCDYFSDEIAAENEVAMIDDIGWNKGQKELTVKIAKFFKYITRTATHKKRIFVVAHTMDKKGEIRLDVDGNNESMILGIVDFVGFLYRSGPNLNLNMCSKSGAEYGIRNDALSSYDGPADYLKLLEIGKS